MMCVKPINVVNPRYRKYLAEDKRFPNLPALDDFFLIVPCGKCFECRKKRASQWRSRLMLEVLHGKYKNAHFITFSFSDEYLKQFHLDDVYNIKRSGIAVPIRRFLERYRKHFGVSLRHFFITELGEKKGRFHLHGIVFDSELKTKEEYDKVWKYGWTWIGYVNVKTVNITIQISIGTITFKKIPKVTDQTFEKDRIPLLIKSVQFTFLSFEKSKNVAVTP